MDVSRGSELGTGQRVANGVGTFVIGGAIQGMGATFVSMLPSERAFEGGMALAAAGLVTSAALGVDVALRGVPNGAPDRSRQLAATGIASGAVAGAAYAASIMGDGLLPSGRIAQAALGAAIGGAWGGAQSLFVEAAMN